MLLGGADFLVAEDLEREIEFLPGESRKEIVVVIVNDLLPEDDEQFLIQLTQADNQSIVLSITQSNVTILSNDGKPLHVLFTRMHFNSPQTFPSQCLRLA